MNDFLGIRYIRYNSNVKLDDLANYNTAIHILGY